jgi:hypothetical protein
MNPVESFRVSSPTTVRGKLFSRQRASYLLLFMLISSPAVCHDWYPNDCCHSADSNGDHPECHPIASCDEIKPQKKGLLWHDYLFEGGQIRKSQDTRCHVCASPAMRSNGGDGIMEILPDALPHCIFVYEKPDS